MTTCYRALQNARLTLIMHRCKNSRKQENVPKSDESCALSSAFRPVPSLKMDDNKRLWKCRCPRELWSDCTLVVLVARWHGDVSSVLSPVIGSTVRSLLLKSWRKQNASMYSVFSITLIVKWETTELTPENKHNNNQQLVRSSLCYIVCMRY